MHLSAISVKGFECIGHNPGIQLNELSKRNIFIGPNNVGKSSLFRALWSANKLAAQRPYDERLPYSLSNTHNLPNNSWQNYDITKDIEIELFIEPTHGFGNSGVTSMSFPTERECRFRFILTGKNTVIFNPFVFVGNSLNSAPLYDIVSEDQWLVLDSNGNYGSRSSIEGNFGAVSRPLLTNLGSSQRFFDPVRTLEKNLAKDGLVDGSKLIPDLYKRQHDTGHNNSFYKLRKSILNRVNGLLESSGTAPLSDFEVKGTEAEPVLVLTQGEIPTPISSMGTGISELFFICASLILDEDKTVQYFLEEPETHLHPGLLRRLFQVFGEYSNVQFFINTHSNVLLDCLSDSDRVYQWTRTPQGESSAHLCSTLHDYHTVLDHLGIRASSLLQTNCTIWVEGPSDRLYVKRWLDEIADGKGERHLVEHSDYSIVFYGGSLRSHHTLDEESSPELISMVRISRFSVVLMDRDLPPEASVDDLDESKVRLMFEAKKYPHHRLAIVTSGREIENDVTSEFLLKAIEKKRKLTPETLSGFSLTGKKNYFDEIAEHLIPITSDELEADKDETKKSPALKDAKQKRNTIRTSLKEKVPLAELVISLCGTSNIHPSYAETIYQHIISSRLDKHPTETDAESTDSALLEDFSSSSLS